MEESAGGQPIPLTLVAFSDPNDLLTYFISQRFKDHCRDLAFANVIVTNADKSWLFLSADPLQAHGGYITNPRVIQMIVEGARP